MPWCSVADPYATAPPQMPPVARMTLPKRCLARMLQTIGITSWAPRAGAQAKEPGESELDVQRVGVHDGHRAAGRHDATELVRGQWNVYLISLIQARRQTGAAGTEMAMEFVLCLDARVVGAVTAQTQYPRRLLLVRRERVEETIPMDDAGTELCVAH